jgi:hypothetical protein
MDFFERHRVKTFDDLKFKPHAVSGLYGGIHAVIDFPNGQSISVVGGAQGLYGDGVKTFEVWASHEPDPRGWLSKDEVTELMLITQSQKIGETNYRV